MNEESTERLLDERGAANKLACSIAMMRKWRLKRIGPRYCRLGRLVRYSEADLVAYIEQNRVETA
jgi:hypothetical protein